MVKTQQELRDYILRKLGHPVQNIEIAEEQLDDSIDDAVQKFQEEHADGVDIGYLPFEIVDDSIMEYQLDEEIQMVTEILKGDDRSSFFPEDVEPLAFDSNSSWIPYSQEFDMVSIECFRQRREMVNSQYNFPVMFDFNQATNKLIIPAPEVGKYMLRVLKSPEVIEDCFDDLWLKQYCVALAKKQWATNLQKFSGIQLPGGGSFNYSDIMSQAQDEIQKLEEDLEEKYADILMPVMG